MDWGSPPRRRQKPGMRSKGDGGEPLTLPDRGWRSEVSQTYTAGWYRVGQGAGGGCNRCYRRWGFGDALGRGADGQEDVEMEEGHV